MEFDLAISRPSSKIKGQSRPKRNTTKDFPLHPADPLIIIDESLKENQRVSQGNLSSKDDEVVFQSIALLTKDIINGQRIEPIFLNNIIRNVLISLSKKILRALHFLFSNLPPKNHDNSPMAQLVMICEIISQQMRSPNEILAGAAARFVGQIQVSSTLAHLMPSLIDCLSNREIFVRKNALISLIHLASKFPHLVENEYGKIFQMLTQEESWECQALCFEFISKFDAVNAFAFVMSIATIVSDLHPEIKYTILVFLDEFFTAILYAEDDSYESNIANDRLRILLNSLLEDKNNEIVLECASFILNQSFPLTLQAQAIQRIVQIFVEENDNPIKLDLLELLMPFKHDHRFRQILVENASALTLQIIGAEHKLICAILRFIFDLIDPLNISSVSENIFVSLQRTNLTLSPLNSNNNLNGSNILHNSQDFLTESINLSLSIILHLCMSFENHVNFRSNDFIEILLKYFVNDNFSMQVSQIFHVIIVKSFQSNPQDAEISHFNCDQIMDRLYSMIPSLELMQLNSIFWLISSGFDSKQCVSQFCDFISSDSNIVDEVLVNSNDFLPLFFCLTKLLFKLPQYSLQYFKILKMIFKVYNTALAKLNFSLTQDAIKQSIHIMNSIISGLHNGKYDNIQKILETTYKQYQENCFNLQDTVNLRYVSEKTSFENSLSSQKKYLFSPIDLSALNESSVNLNQVGSSQFTDLQLITNSALSIPELNCYDGGSHSLTNIVQLSSFGDDIYAECIVLTSKFDVVLDIMLVNRHDHSLYNLSFVLILPEGMTHDKLPKIHYLRSGDLVTFKIRIRLNQPYSDFITPSILYHIRSVASDQIILNLDAIHIAQFDQIHPKSYSPVFFKNNWQKLEWGKNINNIKWEITSSLDQFAVFLCQKLSLSLVEQRPNPQSKIKDKFFASVLNFSGTTFLGEIILVNCVIKSQVDKMHTLIEMPQEVFDSKYNLCFKVRSSDKESVMKLSQKINKLLRIQ